MPACVSEEGSGGSEGAKAGGQSLDKGEGKSQEVQQVEKPADSGAAAAPGHDAAAADGSAVGESKSADVDGDDVAHFDEAALKHHDELAAGVAHRGGGQHGLVCGERAWRRVVRAGCRGLHIHSLPLRDREIFGRSGRLTCATNRYLVSSSRGASRVAGMIAAVGAKGEFRSLDLVSAQEG